MKKFILSLGTVAAIAAPMTMVVACGEEKTPAAPGDDHHDHDHVSETAVGEALVNVDGKKLYDATTESDGSWSIINQDTLDTLLADITALENVTVTLGVHKGTNGSLGNDDIIELVATANDGFEYNSHQDNVTIDHTIGGDSEIADPDEDHSHEHVDQDAVGNALVAIDGADLYNATAEADGSWSIIDETALATLLADVAGLEDVTVTLGVHHGTDGQLGDGDIIELVAVPKDGHEFDSHQANVTIDHTIGAGSAIADPDDAHDHG